MSTQSRLAVILAATVVALLLPVGAAPTNSAVVSLSLPELQISRKERVVGFHFRVNSGRIAQIPNVPIGWNLSVENDPSWNTKIDASIIVAAAAVDPSYFRDFAAVEKYNSSASALEIEGEVVVSTDFSTYRTVRVQTKDFAMKQKSAASADVPSGPVQH